MGLAVDKVYEITLYVGDGLLEEIYPRFDGEDSYCSMWQGDDLAITATIFVIEGC
jgi:hypothetical protein